MMDDNEFSDDAQYVDGEWLEAMASYYDGSLENSNLSYLPVQPTANGTIDSTFSTWRVAVFLHSYYTPLIIVTGSIGNIFSVVVFFRTKLRKLSSSYYLAALGISDTVFLLMNFIPWFPMGAELQSIDTVCKLTTFLSGVSSVLSAWFVVAFTIERFIAVLYPLKRQTMCTVRRAKIVIIGLLLAGLIDCSPLLYFFVGDDNGCYFKLELEAKFMYFNYWDTLLSFVLPLIIIVILNAFTGYTVWQVAGVRRTMTHKRKHNTLQQAQNNTHERADMQRDQTVMIARCTHLNGHHSIKQSCPKSSRQKMSNSSQMKVTKMLLIVSTVFVLLNLPDYDLRIQGFLVEKDTEKEVSHILWQNITHCLFLTNYGINFVLYCITGQNFRKELFAMFKRQSKRRTDCGTQVTVAEFLPMNQLVSQNRKRALTPNVSWNDTYELQAMHTSIANR